MPTTPPPMPMMSSIQTSTSATGQGSNYVVLIVLMWIAWIGVIVVADFMGFMMFAFSDSPSSSNAAKLMIGPMFVWFIITFIAGVVLLIFKGWWQIPLAFALAASPPFLIFLGYNLLSGTSRPSVTPSTLPPPPAIPVRQQVFVPPPTSVPTQPDFQAAVRRATTKPTADK